MKNLFKKIIYGVTISETIMQLFFLILSLSMGEIVYTVSPSKYGTLYDFAAQFVTFGILGLMFGIIAHIYTERIDKAFSSRAQLKTFIYILTLVSISIALIYGTKLYVEGTISLLSIVAKDAVILVSLTGLFWILYLIAAPILDKIDKECVEQMNKKLKE